MSTPNRLAAYRAKAEKLKTKSPNWEQAHDWRYWARNRFQSPNNSRGADGQIFTDSIDQYGDNIGDAHEIVRLNHTGWYADNFQDALIRGAVCRIRSPRGTLYVPVTYCTEWDGTTHHMRHAELAPKGASEADHETAKRDAALYADHIAEREAESAREADAKFQAEQQIENARAEIHDINAQARALIKEIKAAGGFTTAVCGALKNQLADYLRERRAAFRQIEKCERDFWYAVEGA